MIISAVSYNIAVAIILAGTPNHLEVVNGILRDHVHRKITTVLSHKPTFELVTKVGSIPLRYYDLDTLNPHGWLNDEILNAYLYLIAKTFPSITVHSTHLLPLIEKHNTEYEKVKKASRLLPTISTGIHMFPVHTGVHWYLAILDPAARVLYFIDSGTPSLSHQNSVLRTICQAVGSCTSYDLTMIDIPSRKQTNGSDCGVFVCQYAREVASHVHRFGYMELEKLDLTTFGDDLSSTEKRKVIGSELLLGTLQSPFTI